MPFNAIYIPPARTSRTTLAGVARDLAAAAALLSLLIPITLLSAGFSG